jgi:hypothetical protein
VTAPDAQPPAVWQLASGRVAITTDSSSWRVIGPDGSQIAAYGELPADAVRLVPDATAEAGPVEFTTDQWHEAAGVLNDALFDVPNMPLIPWPALYRGARAVAAALAGTTTPTDDETKTAHEALTELIALAAEHPHLGYTAPALAAAVAPLLASTSTEETETDGS